MHFRILDLFLLPKTYYNKIKNGKFTLILGILLVGLINTVFVLTNKYSMKEILTFYKWPLKNIAFIGVFIILFGLIDILFFSKPLVDVIKYFKRSDTSINNGNMMSKVMKIYVTAHFAMLAYIAVIAVSILFPTLKSSVVWEYFFLFYQGVILSVWFSLIITRGLNVIYKIQPKFKILIFLAAYLWSFFEGNAMTYMYKVIINKFM